MRAAHHPGGEDQIGIAEGVVAVQVSEKHCLGTANREARSPHLSHDARSGIHQKDSLAHHDRGRRTLSVRIWEGSAGAEEDERRWRGLCAQSEGKGNRGKRERESQQKYQIGSARAPTRLDLSSTGSQQHDEPFVPDLPISPVLRPFAALRHRSALSLFLSVLLLAFPFPFSLSLLPSPVYSFPNTSIAALRPLMPITLPPGWVQAPQR